MRNDELDLVRSLISENDPDMTVENMLAFCEGYDDFDTVLDEVGIEIDRQSELWGQLHDDQHTPYDWTRIMLTWLVKANDSIEERDFDEYRGRLIQLAAIAVSAARALDRKKKEKKKRA